MRHIVVQLSPSGFYKFHGGDEKVRLPQGGSVTYQSSGRFFAAVRMARKADLAYRQHSAVWDIPPESLK
jgi:hypothetical protein